MIPRAAVVAGVVLAIAAAAFAELGGSFSAGLNHPAIQYSRRAGTDIVARLNRQLADGTAKLEYEPGRGYLRAVLAALDVPVESQMVVFSKTGLQARITSPRNPRSIFFNDAVTVAWVRGEPFVELAVQDPTQGVLFYTLDQLVQTDAPRFQRRDGCLTCHESLTSMGVPGMILKSTFVTADGIARFHLGFSVPDHRTPLEERWGGWYVTGKSGTARHRGNAGVTDMEQPERMITAETLDVATLRGKFDTDAYLSPYSDVVALMVFEHQMRMMNLITRFGWEVRVALHEKSDTLADLLRNGAREFKVFAARGPRDRKGRSLRDLDLEHRLMKYPCSYMIYSEAFDALPAQAKQAVYGRMSEVLRDQAVIEILRDTKNDWPQMDADKRR